MEYLPLVIYLDYFSAGLPENQTVDFCYAHLLSRASGCAHAHAPQFAMDKRAPCLAAGVSSSISLHRRRSVLHGR